MPNRDDIPLPRTPRALEGEPFDAIVVGGGVQGAAIALEAALRGLRPLVVEASDYGGGTSANTLRILHGGLRSLQRLDLSGFRESVRDRRWWMECFPELVDVLPCVMPLYDRGVHRGALLRPALNVNDLLSRDRNRGVRAELRLPPGRMLGREETLSEVPLARREGLRGGALWYDASMTSPQRLVIEMLRWTVGLGGGCLNYVAATDLLVEGGVVVGVRARDALDGAELELRARAVIDATGPWSRRLQAAGKGWPPAGFTPSLAFNLLLDLPLESRGAVAVRPARPDASVHFLRPYGRLTLAGTVHLPWSAERGSDASVDDAEIEAFLGDLRSAVPHFAPTGGHVLRVLAGLIPAQTPGRADVRRRADVVNHGRSAGPRGFLRVDAVKFTSAPSTARRAVDRAFPGSHPVHGTESRPTVRRWISQEKLLELRASSPEAAKALVREVARSESVAHLDDLVLRRLDWTLEREDGARPGGVLETVLGKDALAALRGRGRTPDRILRAGAVPRGASMGGPHDGW